MTRSLVERQAWRGRWRWEGDTEGRSRVVAQSGPAKTELGLGRSGCGQSGVDTRECIAFI